MSGFEMHPRELARFREQSSRPSIGSDWVCARCRRRVSEITGRKRASIGSGWICPACATTREGEK